MAELTAKALLDKWDSGSEIKRKTDTEKWYCYNQMINFAEAYHEQKVKEITPKTN